MEITNHKGGVCMLIKLKPVFMNRIWGGRNLETFHYTLPSGNVGEAWCVSAHEAGSTYVEGGEHNGKTLREVYCHNRELFANDPHDEFPILIKILDAQQDLSIQIHPDDLYAKQHEESYGKTECWYVLNTNGDNQLILGHSGDTSTILNAIQTKRWNDVLRYHPIQKGDFFFVPAGTIHAICKGSVIYEVQQSSDITYRLYDYERLENGKLRELHEQKSLDVLKPFDEAKVKTREVLYQDEMFEHHRLVDCAYFEVNHYIFHKEKHITIKNDTYLLCSVFYGTCTIAGETFTHGDHFICTSQLKSIEVKGTGELFVTSVKF